MRHAVILAGGSGSRLWPASCRKRPKQFLALGLRPGESLIAATARRLARARAAITVVTAAEQAGLVHAELSELAREDVFSEPTARNTAAALGLAAVYLCYRDADAIMGAIPADQTVAQEERFVSVVDRAFAVAEQSDVIVTVGIVPTAPETGFGYLHTGDAFSDGVLHVREFVEKPDTKTAERYLASGNYLWNGGMFFVKAAVLLAQIKQHMPETHAVLSQIADALRSGGYPAGDAKSAELYPTVPSISIDYGVMERATNVVTVPGDFGWNDVGSWSALSEFREGDDSGNIAEGTVVLHDAKDNIVIGDADHAIAVIGVEGLVVVQSGNRILVVPRDRAQDVRAAVDALKERSLDEYL